MDNIHQIHRFLEERYFGNTTDLLLSASKRAYRDWCRTIDKTANASKTIVPIDDVTKKIKAALKLLEQQYTSAFSQQDYDKWHKDTCEEIIKECRCKCVKIYFGQAQKWLNMTLKYLYILLVPRKNMQCLNEYNMQQGIDIFNLIINITPFMHVPIDNVILSIAKDLPYRIEATSPSSWSRWTYKEYMQYQNLLRKHITHIPLFDWEFTTWTEQQSNE